MASRGKYNTWTADALKLSALPLQVIRENGSESMEEYILLTDNHSNTSRKMEYVSSADNTQIPGFIRQ